MATVAAGALGMVLLCVMAPVARAEPVKNIVLVHGAFVDGSGWRPVYDVLVRDCYMVAQADHIISPDLERMYAARAHSHTVEIAGASHSVYRSHPKEVTALIEQAALHAADRESGRFDASSRP